MKQKKRRNSRVGFQRAARKKRRELFLVGVIIVVLFLGVVVGLGWRKIFSRQIEKTPVLDAVIEAEQSFVGEFKVVRVIDGDTVELEGGEKVRYIGMNTPAIVDPQKPAECFGQEAAEKNKNLVEGKMVRLEKDNTDRDKYGRLLRYVYVGDTFVNLELIGGGFAKMRVYPKDVKFLKQFIRTQEEAKSAARGLWSACPAEKI